MTTAIIIFSAVTILGVLLSALFSGMETGFYTINRVRLLLRAARGNHSAQRLRREILQPNRLLATLLIGNNIANYLGSYGIAAILDQAGFTPGQSVALNAIILIPLLFILGETLPKDLFRVYTDRWSYQCVNLLIGARLVFTWTGLVPIVRVSATLATRILGGDPNTPSGDRQRMSQLIKEGVGAGVLTETQTNLADRVLTIHQRTVVDEMVDWRDVRTLNIAIDSEDRTKLLHQTNVTRVPVLDENGRVIGVLSLLQAALDPDQSTKALMSDCRTFAPDVPVLDALRHMQADRHRLAVIVEPETDRPIGIVTVKDLVEPLTGELKAW
jgi:CBS domain containing-hemolysin-like protein